MIKVLDIIINDLLDIDAMHDITPHYCYDLSAKTEIILKSGNKLHSIFTIDDFYKEIIRLENSLKT